MKVSRGWWSEAYSFLSRRGPFGLLYTRTAMIIGQFILAFPIMASLTVASVRGMDKRIRSAILALGSEPGQGLCIPVALRLRTGD